MGRAAIAWFTCPTSTGTFDITSSDLGGLTAKAAIVFVVNSNNYTGSLDNHTALSFGATDGTRQWSTSAQSENNQGATDNDRQWQTDQVITMLLTNGNIDGEAAFSSFITNGVRLNCGNAFGSAWAGWALLIAGDDVNVYAGNADLPDNGVSDSITDPGFEPDWGMFSSTGQNVETSETTYKMSIGMAVNDDPGATQYCWAISEQHNRTAGGAPRGRFYNNMCVGEANSSSPDPVTTSDITSWDANGFTIRGNVGNPATGDKFGYIVVGGGFDFSLDLWQVATTAGNQSFPSVSFTPATRFHVFSAIDTINTNEQGDSGTHGIFVTSDSEQGNANAEIESGSDPTDCDCRANRAAAGGTYDYYFGRHGTTYFVQANHVDIDTWNIVNESDIDGYVFTLTLGNITGTPIHARGHLMPNVLRGAGGFDKSPMLTTMQGFNSL